MMYARPSSGCLQARHGSATPGDILQMRQALGRFPETALTPNGQAVQPLLAAQPTQLAPKLLMQPALSLVDWTNEPVPQAEPPAADQQASIRSCVSVCHADATLSWLSGRLQCLQLEHQASNFKIFLMAS